eukprot:9476261-Pyramimonas_sp.AAC.1
MNQGLEAINVIGRTALAVGNSVDNAIEKNDALEHDLLRDECVRREVRCLKRQRWLWVLKSPHSFRCISQLCTRCPLRQGALTAVQNAGDLTMRATASLEAAFASPTQSKSRRPRFTPPIEYIESQDEVPPHRSGSSAGASTSDLYTNQVMRNRQWSLEVYSSRLVSLCQVSRLVKGTSSGKPSCT